MLSVETRDLHALARATQGIEKSVKRDLNKRIRTVAEPIAREVRNAALGLPAGSESKRQRLGKKKLEQGARLGLRAGLAAATEVRQRNNARNPGVRIVVSRSVFAKQTGKSAKLPRAIEGLRRRPLRHPLFGNRAQWYDAGKKPFLLRTVLPHKGKVREAILDEYEKTVDRALRRWML